MLFTPHFFGPGDNAGVANAPASARANLAKLATLLEAARSAGGDVPLKVTSGYRSPGLNAAVGGSGSSQHLTGSAADFVPVGRLAEPLFRQWADATFATLPRSAYGQAILYPWTTGHVHLSLPNRASGKTGELLVEVGKNRYVPWTPGTAFPRYGNAATIIDRDDREGAAQLELLLYLLLAVAIVAAVL